MSASALATEVAEPDSCARASGEAALGRRLDDGHLRVGGVGLRAGRGELRLRLLLLRGVVGRVDLDEQLALRDLLVVGDVAPCTVPLTRVDTATTSASTWASSVVSLPRDSQVNDAVDRPVPRPTTAPEDEVRTRLALLGRGSLRGGGLLRGLAAPATGCSPSTTFG